MKHRLVAVAVITIFSLTLAQPGWASEQSELGEAAGLTIENLSVPALPKQDNPSDGSGRFFGDVGGLTRAGGFIGRVDAHNAHLSDGPDVSGHVSWTLISGVSTKITVTSSLRVKTSLWGYATKAGPVSATVYPGGGAGKAAVARFRCRSIQPNTWWTYGEGFAPGSTKPFGSHVGNTQSVKCGYK